MRYKYWLGVGASLILGLIFGAAGLSKLLHPAEAFKIFFNPFSPFPSLFTPDMARMVVIWLPRIELIIGLLLISGVATKLVATFSSVLIIGFIAANSWLISHGLGFEPCDCFGGEEIIAQAELTVRGSLYMDIGMLALVLATLFGYPGKFLLTRPWYLRAKVVDDSMSKEVS